MGHSRAQTSRSRNWLFTCNRYTDVDIAHIQDLARGSSVRYLVFGKEVAPTTGHQHLQGFVIFKNCRKFGGVKRFFEGLSNPNIQIGDEKSLSMAAYCKKDGDFWEFGEPPVAPKESGARGGAAAGDRFRWCIRQAERGKLDRIRNKYPGLYTRYLRTWQIMQKDKAPMPKDREGTTGVWIFGEAGAGKSHYARETYPDFYDKPCNKWWDNYKGEKNVLIDDLDVHHSVLAHHIKRWADKYSFSGEVKGSQINLRPDHIVITSQYLPDEIWTDQKTRDAINRRFKFIKVFIDKNGDRKIIEVNH